MSGSSGYTVLSGILSAMFVAAGAIKLSPVPASLHNGMIAEFREYATKFPGNVIGCPINPLTYMYAAGLLDFSLGMGLLLGSRKVKVVCSVGVMADMALFIPTEISLGMYGKSLVPIATLIMSFCLYRHLTDKIKIT